MDARQVDRMWFRGHSVSYIASQLGLEVSQLEQVIKQCDDCGCRGLHECYFVPAAACGAVFPEPGGLTRADSYAICRKFNDPR
jgi:hypothetical protein